MNTSWFALPRFLAHKITPVPQRCLSALPVAGRRYWPVIEQLEQRICPALYAVNALNQVQLLSGSATAPAPTPHAVVFYETAVAGYQALLGSVAPGTDEVLLNAAGDGVQQMAAFLHSQQDLTAIHLVAHGSAGAVELGAATLDSATLPQYAGALAAVGAVLAPEGQLNLWSCDVAAGTAGQAFVGELAKATGAGVAAASHLVGAADLGGSWQLDATVGEAGPAASPFHTEAQAHFHSVLEGTWSTTGSLASARFAQTATLLGNGKVLVTGGSNGGLTALSSAELYDPVAGIWSSAGNMASARFAQTATLLGNGKVLVAGGFNGSTAQSSAELYDPVAGTWSSAGNMASARQYQTATLLGNGKVLVTGGNGGGALSSAELYDPVAGTWSSAGNMASARESQTATLLGNGKVLVTGGANTSGALSSAELYDPVAGTWSSAGNMAFARGEQTATMLGNGKVLVTGGFSNSSGGHLSSAELYDPVAGTWSSAGNMASARDNQRATLLGNGKVLVTGGSNISGYLSSAELYDPVAGIWSSAGNMASARDNQTATLLGNGKVLVTGGGNGSGALSSAELFDDPVGTTWFAAGSLPTPREYATATLLPNGLVLVAGGQDSSGNALASAELYNPQTNTFSPTTGSLTTARYFATATLLPDGLVLVAGGYNSSGNALASAELYDPQTRTFSPTTGSLATARFLATATLLPNGLVLVADGQDSSGNALASAELYDPQTRTFSPTTGSLATARLGATATLLPNGLVLVAGGQDSSFSAVASAELYDPQTRTFSPTTGSLATARTEATATLLPNGLVLVAGGFGSSSVLASAELYNPQTRTFSPTTGSLGTARYGATATLLPNGLVLVAGGSGSSGSAVASAELYDPQTRTFSPTTGSLPTARYNTTATLLPNGLVLVAGGFGSSGVLASAELYGGTAPAITTSNATFTYGSAGSATVVTATAGYPKAPTFSATGLPSGLTLDPNTGVLSGTPTTASGSPITITVTASNGVSPDATGTFQLTVNKASQTITFPAPTSPVTFGVAPIPLSATGGGSGNPVTFSIDGSSTATGSISSGVLTVTSAGTIVINANQAGNANYTAAPQVQRTLVVNKADQTITFGPLSPVTFGVGPITLSASGGGSGHPVTFSIDASSTGTGTINSGVLTVTGAGTIVIDANQTGNSNYNAAPQVQQTLTVNKADQTITFGPLSPVTFGVGPITLSATGGGSGNPVTFSVVSGSGSISGNTLIVTGAGNIVIQADQAGDANYNAATAVQETEVVNKANQTIAFGPLGPVTLGVAPITLSASGGGSGQPATFRIVSGPGSLNGSVLTVTGAGTIVVQADQAGDANYNAAMPVQQAIVVNSALLLSPLAPTQGLVGQTFAGSLTVSGGTGTYGNLIVTGLPAGLTAVLSGSTITVSGTPTAEGPFSLNVSVQDNTGVTGSTTALLTVSPTIFAVGSDAGIPAVVNVYNTTTGVLLFSLTPFGSFTGGARVAVATINGTPEVIVGAGPGGGPQVNVYNGATGQLLAAFYGLSPTFTGGVFVAAAASSSGQNWIAVSAGAGGGPQVVVFTADTVLASAASGTVPTPLTSFYAFSPTFGGGVTVALGDVTGNGTLDVIAGAGPGGGPQVIVVNGTQFGSISNTGILPDGALLASFFAYAPSFTGGVFVTMATVNGVAEIVTGAGPGGSAQIALFQGDSGLLLGSFFDPRFGNSANTSASTGVRVGSLTLNGQIRILAAAGPGSAPLVDVFNAETFGLLDEFFTLAPSFSGGQFIAG